MPRQRMRLNREKKDIIQYIKDNPTATVMEVNRAITPSLPADTLDTWLRNQGYRKEWRKIR